MRKCKTIAIALATLLLMGILAGCGATDEVIKLGNDEVPSLYSVVGERKISGSSSGISNGVRYAEKTYAAGQVTVDDLEAYWNALTGPAGFISTMDSQQQGTRIALQAAKESADEGKIVLVEIVFDSAGSTVMTYRVAEGTLTLNDLSL